jgi:uracil-DNA glycosylase
MPASPDSHKGVWSGFITKLLHLLNEPNPNCIYLLWGDKASDYAKYITSKNILISTHPSPQSASKGFLRCDHFNEANNILLSLGKKPIDWNIK